MNLLRRASHARPSMFRRFGIAAALLFLSACSILPATENLEIYPLPAAGSAPGLSGHPSGDPLPWTLRLATPNSSHMTDSPRILALRQGGQLRVLRVLDLGQRRGPAPEARLLYEELISEA